MCDLCPKTYSILMRFNRHKSNHQNGKIKLKQKSQKQKTNFQCEICKKQMQNYNEMWLHKRTHSEPNLKCNHCKKGTLYAHKRNMHGKSLRSTQNCTQCDMVLASKYSLNMHIETIHLRQKKYHCSLCEYRTGHPSSLKSHIENVHDKLKVKCPICPWEGRKLGLTIHKKSKHMNIPGQNAKKHACNICDKSYFRPEHLTKHTEKAHLGVRYQCQKCDFKSTTTGGLNIHFKSKHKGVKSPCPHCSHKAYDNSSLAKHIKIIHLGLKPYKCQVCDLDFTTRNNLIKHEKNHTGEKLNVCPF